MNHVIVYIQPFLMEQEIAVYQNGECIKTQKVCLGDIAPVCYALCKEYDTHQVDLAGPGSYTEKIRDELFIKTDFDNFEINVTLY